MNIEPMLLSEVEDDSILKKNWIYEIKYNGVRAILHVKDHKIVGIRGRSNNPLLYCFPELKEEILGIETGILDAEIVVMKNGKSVFYNGVDQRRTNPTPAKLRDYPVSVIVFDAIQIGSEVLVNKPYKDRLELLQRQTWTSRIQLIESTNDGIALWNQVIEDDEEGLVAKDPMAPYEIGVRSKRYQKYKNYKWVDVIVEKVESNPKGTKIYSNVLINNVNIVVEAQQGGCFNINVGDVVRVKYLDIVGSRLIQPTRF